jgi:hypothetical protein
MHERAVFLNETQGILGSYRITPAMQQCATEMLAPGVAALVPKRLTAIVLPVRAAARSDCSDSLEYLMRKDTLGMDADLIRPASSRAQHFSNLPLIYNQIQSHTMETLVQPNTGKAQQTPAMQQQRPDTRRSCAGPFGAVSCQRWASSRDRRQTSQIYCNTAACSQA